MRFCAGVSAGIVSTCLRTIEKKGEQVAVANRGRRLYSPSFQTTKPSNHSHARSPSAVAML